MKGFPWFQRRGLVSGLDVLSDFTIDQLSMEMYPMGVWHQLIKAHELSSNLHCYVETTVLKYNYRSCKRRLRPEVYELYKGKSGEI